MKNIGINIEKKIVDLDFFISLIDKLKNKDELYDERIFDILDSFSENQFKSKSNLIIKLLDLGLLDNESNVAILGSWYGSIFVNILDVNEINCYDMDDKTIRVGKRLFGDKANYYQKNIFNDSIKETIFKNNVIINTSCEHMPDINTWKHWHNFKSGTVFAFQSNNMYGIEGHINCVDSVEEFEKQLPPCKILYKDEIDIPGWEDRNGKRFTIIGVKI